MTLPLLEPDQPSPPRRRKARKGSATWIADGIELLFPPAYRESLRQIAEPPPVPDPDDPDYDIDNTSPVAADWIARTAQGNPPDIAELRRWCYRWWPDDHQRAEREAAVLFDGLRDLANQERLVGLARSVVQTAQQGNR